MAFEWSETRSYGHVESRSYLNVYGDGPSGPFSCYSEIVWH